MLASLSQSEAGEACNLEVCGPDECRESNVWEGEPLSPPSSAPGQDLGRQETLGESQQQTRNKHTVTH